MLNYKLYFDGACNPNPGGTASYGFHLTADDKVVDQGYGVIGKGKMMTDVYAEYCALTNGLSCFVRHLSGPARLSLLGDSKFVIDQINQGPSPSTKPRYEDRFRRSISNQLRYIESLSVPVEILWIPREQNEVCDALAKKMRLMNAAIGIA